MDVKADLHLHSKYSERPSEWFLQKIGAGESYSEPEHLYALAKGSGMDYVTITDHNRIEGVLKLMEKRPEDVFTGVEATAYFPEDRCKIHVLIYDFDESQFEEIQKHRQNIYDLRDFIKENNLPHSVAHSGYSVNGKLTMEHFEKLLLLFDVFEGINGGRSKIINTAVTDALTTLTPEDIDRIHAKHKIEPFSEEPWIKGFTGGSDDHSGMFVAKTFTRGIANCKEEFLWQLKMKQTRATGRNNDFASLVFMVYKIAWDYSKSKSSKIGKSLINNVNEVVFGSKSLNLIQWAKLKGYNLTAKEDNVIARKIVDLILKLDKFKDGDPDRRLSIVYDAISDIADHIIIDLTKYFKEEGGSLNLFGVANKISGLLPAVFLSAPFIHAFNHLFKDRDLAGEIRRDFHAEDSKEKKRILWFSDTVDDLNGVSVSLKEIAWNAYRKDINISLAASFADEENTDRLPPNILKLKNIFDFRAPYYDKYILKVPSLLDSLKRIYEHEPDEIYISTPGFVGLVGLLAAKLLHVRSVGIFHTDFERQLDAITDDDSISAMSSAYVRWFYNAVDVIAVPSREYAKTLAEKGFDPEKIKLFKRWINFDIFKPVEDARDYVKQKHNLNGGASLLFTGRISQDKNLDLLVEAYEKLLEKHPDTVLLIVGDGPYYEELKKKTKSYPNIILPGRMSREELTKYYCASEIFVFPSEADTFGMSALEAQACGLPCLVSGIGGPQEIIQNGLTGKSITSGTSEDWAREMAEMIELWKNDPKEFEKIKNMARKNVFDRYRWDLVGADLVSEIN